jgi:stage II sporulation protein D
MQRLGWLLAALLVTHHFCSFALALPLEPSKLASELKMTPKTVRVRLSDLGRVMTIKGTDLALSLAKRPELGNVRADEWVIDCKRSLIYQPESGKSRRIPASGVLIESMSGILSINQKRFREQIVVYPKELLSPYDSSQRANSECLVVNHIDIEHYVESVVNGEFNSQWAESAVQVQIIAARTYALYQMKEMRKDRGRVFDVESTQKDQVYLGLDRADSRGTRLVALTRGMILTSKLTKNLDPIKAFYHASCGGYTTLPQTVWGAKFPGFTKGVPCPYCAHSPSYAWDYTMSFNEIEKHIAKGIRVDSTNRKLWPKEYADAPQRWILMNVRAVSGGIFEKSHLIRPASRPSNSHFISEANAATELSDDDRGINLAEAESITTTASSALSGQSARQTGAKYLGQADQRVQSFIFEFVRRDDPWKHLSVNMNAYQARNWFDPAKLKSTLFRIQKVGRSLVFKGKGSGHGVGLCQWGAKRMGEMGFTRDQIIGYYYPGAKIVRLWN